MILITLEILITHHHGAKKQLNKTQENHTSLHTLFNFSSEILDRVKVTTQYLHLIFSIITFVGQKLNKYLIREDREDV